jgi:hypothetical protein
MATLVRGDFKQADGTALAAGNLDLTHVGKVNVIQAGGCVVDKQTLKITPGAVTPSAATVQIDGRTAAGADAMFDLAAGSFAMMEGWLPKTYASSAHVTVPPIALQFVNSLGYWIANLSMDGPNGAYPNRVQLQYRDEIMQIVNAAWTDATKTLTAAAHGFTKTAGANEYFRPRVGTGIVQNFHPIDDDPAPTEDTINIVSDINGAGADIADGVGGDIIKQIAEVLVNQNGFQQSLTVDDTSTTEKGQPFSLCLYVRSAAGSSRVVEAWAKLPWIGGADPFGPHWWPLGRVTVRCQDQVKARIETTWRTGRTNDFVRINHFWAGTAGTFDPAASPCKWRFPHKGVGGGLLAQGIHRVNDGRAVLAYIDGTSESSHDDIAAYVRKSQNSTLAIWGSAATLFAAADGVHCFGLAMVAQGDQVLVAVKEDSNDNTTSSRLVAKYSSDGGETFGEEIEIKADFADQSWTLQRNGIVTSGGLWIIPYMTTGSKLGYAYSATPTVAASWAAVETDITGIEPRIVEDLAHNLLVCVTRSTYYPAITTCANTAAAIAAGSWSAPVSQSGKTGEGASRINSAVDTIELLYNRGTLYLLTMGWYGRRDETCGMPRQGVDVWVSADGGTTWSQHERSPLVRISNGATMPLQCFDAEIQADGSLLGTLSSRGDLRVLVQEGFVACRPVSGPRKPSK